jgi:hypothetical protein
MEWMTPSTPGHYCIQVSFAYPDDANPFDNLGQDNTQVLQALSPAHFAFRLRNSGRARTRFRFEVDTYQILPPPPCPVADTTRRDRRTARSGGLPGSIRARNSRANNPLPAEWAINFSHANPVLDPDEEVNIKGTITPADTFHGTQPVNIHTFSEKTLICGVTIILNRT